jgi:hypothetical protein
MKLLLNLLILIVLPCQLLHAQSGNTNVEKSDALSRLEDYQLHNDNFSIYNDSLIVDQYYKLLQKNRYQKGVPGFRIRIFTDSGLGAKENQKKVRARFLSLYPDIDAYYSYDAPDFKVYIGDCKTKSEAFKLYERIKANFPDALVVSDMIYIDGLE